MPLFSTMGSWLLQSTQDPLPFGTALPRGYLHGSLGYIINQARIPDSLKSPLPTIHGEWPYGAMLHSIIASTGLSVGSDRARIFRRELFNSKL